MMDYATRRHLVLKAAAQAEKVRIACNIKQFTPVDPIELAEKRGCEVRFMSLPSLEGVYSPEPEATIILGSERSVGRRNFTCSHELAHHEFKHGMRVEELRTASLKTTADKDEFLADVFAGNLLMPKAGVLRELAKRKLDSKKIEPIQLFTMASFFGVGYTTLIEHMTWTLNLLSSNQRKILLKTPRKALKEQFGGIPGCEVVIADEHWGNKAIDLEVADILVLPLSVSIEISTSFQQQAHLIGHIIYKAIKRGYGRAFSKESDWAANIRVSNRKYTGLARYRFLNDPEEDIT